MSILKLTKSEKPCVPDSTRRSTFSAATIESKKRVLDADDNESRVRARTTAWGTRPFREPEMTAVRTPTLQRAQTRGHN